MTNYAFSLVDMDEVLFHKGMDLDDVLDEIIDIIGDEIFDYDSLGHLVKKSKIGEINWSDRDMMYRIALDLSSAFGEDVGVIVDYDN